MGHTGTLSRCINELAETKISANGANGSRSPDVSRSLMANGRPTPSQDLHCCSRKPGTPLCDPRPELPYGHY